MMLVKQMNRAAIEKRVSSICHWLKHCTLASTNHRCVQSEPKASQVRIYGHTTYMYIITIYNYT